MKQGFDKLLDTAGQVADSAVKTTGKLVAKGRDKAEEVALRSRLAKVHRQLGALVYSLRKNGEENEPMVEWYIGEIDRLKGRINALQNPPADPVRVYGDYKDGGAQEDAMFRGGDGD